MKDYKFNLQPTAKQPTAKQPTAKQPTAKRNNITQRNNVENEDLNKSTPRRVVSRRKINLIESIVDDITTNVEVKNSTAINELRRVLRIFPESIIRQIGTLVNNIFKSPYADPLSIIGSFVTNIGSFVDLSGEDDDDTNSIQFENNTVKTYTKNVINILKKSTKNLKNILDLSTKSSVLNRSDDELNVINAIINNIIQTLFDMIFDDPINNGSYVPFETYVELSRSELFKKNVLRTILSVYNLVSRKPIGVSDNLTSTISFNINNITITELIRLLNTLIKPDFVSNAVSFLQSVIGNSNIEIVSIRLIIDFLTIAYNFLNFITANERNFNNFIDDLLDFIYRADDDNRLALVDLPLVNELDPRNLIRQETTEGEALKPIKEEELLFSKAELNFNGTVLALSTNGIVKTYSYNTRTSKWSKLGQDIIPSEPSKYFGYSISLNRNGKVLAIGSPVIYPTAGDSPGYVEVLTYNTRTKLWENIKRLSAPFNGNQLVGSLYKYGYSIKLNAAGNRLVVGDPSYTVNTTTESSTVNEVGAVFVYQLNSRSRNWKPLGNPIITNDEDDEYFGYSVSMNDSGEIIAVGDPDFNIGLGRVIVYRYNSRTRFWDPYGSNNVIERNDGESIGYGYSPDLFGSSISLSGNGNRIAIGSPGDDFPHPSSPVNEAGNVVVYELNRNTWRQVGEEIESTESGGCSTVSISKNGKRVAFNNRINNNVLIYEDKGSNSSTPGWNVFSKEIQLSDQELPYNDAIQVSDDSKYNTVISGNGNVICAIKYIDSSIESFNPLSIYSSIYIFKSV